MAKRRRGRHAPRPARPGRDRFEALVERALDRIPIPFAAALDEVAVIVEDEPSPAQLRESGLAAGETLYGLYEGTPRTEYAADWVVAPNRISLFRRPLETDFDDPRELEDEVERTVIHELAHHLGIDDERLAELGYE